MPRHLLRLLVPSPDRERVLARPNGLAGWTLPVVPVEDLTAWTGQADAAAHKTVGTATAPVRRLDLRTWELEARGRIPAVGTTWIGPDEAARLGADAEAVTGWAVADASPPRSPHLRPGWRDEVESWLAEVLDEPPDGELVVVRHWELGAVLAAPTPAGTVAVKEAGVGFTREAATVAALTGLPGAPAVIASRGPRLVTPWADPTGDAAPAAAALGALQRGATARLADLRDAGCPDAAALAASVDPAVSTSLEEVAALGLADSVVHGDARRATAVGPAECDESGAVVIVGWTDATVGCPAIDLGFLVGHDGDEADDATSVVATWCAAFDCDPGRVGAALPAIRTVAAALAVARHHEHRSQLPETIHPIWDAWTDEWERRLGRLLS